MIAIKKILVPTDFSDSSAPAIGYAVSLARKHGAEVAVLHVMSSKAMKKDFAGGYVTEGLMEPGTLIGTTRATDMDSLLERRKRIIHDFVQQKIGSEALRGIKITAVVRFGKPVDEILAAAKEEQADLIVMNRESGLSLRGHFTDRIAKQAPCPVVSLQVSAEVRTEDNERVPIVRVEKWAA
ncbi:MAG TPA: universal stress protein [Candidatus Binatia bacterium]|nr:universal stress protein [Candidatus Binatia bacterium]